MVGVKKKKKKLPHWKHDIMVKYSNSIFQNLPSKSSTSNRFTDTPWWEAKITSIFPRDSTFYMMNAQHLQNMQGQYPCRVTRGGEGSSDNWKPQKYHHTRQRTFLTITTAGPEVLDSTPILFRLLASPEQQLNIWTEDWPTCVMYEQEPWVLCSITDIPDSTVCLPPGTVFSMKSHDFSLQTLSGLAAAWVTVRLVAL